MNRKRLIAITAPPTCTVHTIMAAEALKRVAASLKKKMTDEGVDNNCHDLLSSEELAAVSTADLIILAPDAPVERARFAKALIEAAAELAKLDEKGSQPAALCCSKGKKFVAVTVYPNSITHTFIAATSLRKAAEALGYEIKIEMQDLSGVKDPLSPEEIAAADAVVIATDLEGDTARFSRKPLYLTTTKHAIHAAQEVLTNALSPSAQKMGESLLIIMDQAATAKIRSRVSPYKHLMTGISYMLPMVIVGGLCLAFSFALNRIEPAEPQTRNMAWALNLIGVATAFPLFVAMLSGFIAFSIAGRPALVSGLIGGMLAQSLGAGFFGGIVSGYMAGYCTKLLAKRLHIPDIFESLKPILILPFLSSAFVGLIMVYLIAPSMRFVLSALVGWLNHMQGMNALLFGMLLGGMMAIDVGGPLNKSAYTFALGLLASNVYTPIATVMVAGMTPPLGLAIAAWLFKNRFDVGERAAAGSAFVLGLAFITEGAIPFVTKNPLSVIPALIVGSAISGGISMLCGVELFVPHGGLFASLLPGVVKHLGVFFSALVLGTCITTILLFVLKKPIHGNN